MIPAFNAAGLFLHPLPSKSENVLTHPRIRGGRLTIALLRMLRTGLRSLLL